MFENLNEKQLEAVNTLEGPLLVIAGAGSGKTRVITYRIANMLEKGIDPYNILAITFTNKAAKEMKSRVLSLCGSKASVINLSTFHSFGAKILRSTIQHIGYSPNFTIIDSNDQIAIIKQILRDKNIDAKKFTPRVIASKISNLKNDGLGYEEYQSFAMTFYDKLVCEIFEDYSKRLFKSNCVDFDDLLTLPIKVFEVSPEILQQFQQRYQYILVDEFQDTNSLQAKLVEMLSSQHKNVCVVGDEDQSIYSWRGANVSNILNFDKDFSGTKVVKLEENYRSTKKIIEAANKLINNNSLRKEKVLYTNNEDGKDIIVNTYDDEKQEARDVVNSILDLISAGEQLNDIAILYRTNAQSRIFEEILLRENIPYNIIGSYYFYSRKEIKDVLAYLRLIVNKNDDISFMRVVNEPKRGIGTSTVNMLVEIASGNSISLFEAIGLKYLNAGANKKLLGFQDLINDLTEYAKEHSVTELIKYVIEKSTMKAQYADDSVESSVRREYLDELCSVSESFSDKNAEMNLETFLEEISLVADIKQYGELDQKVTLMSVHSAKGLEFNNVFVVGLEEGIFPHKNSIDTNEELEEERRLCYVAITRAKKMLYLSHTNSRLFLGNRNYNMRSRFINEINSKNIAVDLAEKYDEQIDDIFNVGSKVKHKTFGEGIIVQVESEIYTVAFGVDYGVKKISAFYNSLELIG